MPIGCGRRATHLPLWSHKEPTHWQAWNLGVVAGSAGWRAYDPDIVSASDREAQLGCAMHSEGW